MPPPASSLRPALSVQRRIKYGLDRLVAIVLLIVLSPLLGLIAVAIRLQDGGPALFKQTRAGLLARPFTMVKFRTMVPNADRYLDDRGRVLNPDRITRVGRVLRVTSLDELPQLFNILKGDMSFIGPRPVLPDHVARYTPGQMQRFRMKPGITGLAQVNGRNQLPWSQRITFDIAYIDAYSLWLDLKILLRTVRVVFRQEGLVLDRNVDHADDLGSASSPHVSANPAADDARRTGTDWPVSERPEG